MRELENYINDVERYIGNFESVISDIENSHYIDIMVEENNEKVKKSVSFYELKHYAHSSYVSNYFYEVQNDLSKAKQELDNLKNILRDLKNNNFAGINEITNNSNSISYGYDLDINLYKENTDIPLLIYVDILNIKK